MLRFTLFLHTVTLSAHYINRGHNIEFQRTEGSKSIVICPDSVSIQRSALWLFPDTRLQRRKGGSRWGEQGQHKHSRASEHQHLELAPGLGSGPPLKANPQMRGPRCVSGVSGGRRREGAKHKHLSDIQQISIFKIPNSAVKFQGKWRAWGKRGFVLIWNVALCAYFVQDFLSGGQIILHPKQTLLFLLVTALQLIITSHTTITNECEPHHYPQSLTGFRKKA